MAFVIRENRRQVTETEVGPDGRTDGMQHLMQS